MQKSLLCRWFLDRQAAGHSEPLQLQQGLDMKTPQGLHLLHHWKERSCQKLLKNLRRLNSTACWFFGGSAWTWPSVGISYLYHSASHPCCRRPRMSPGSSGGRLWQRSGRGGEGFWYSACPGRRGWMETEWCTGTPAHWRCPTHEHLSQDHKNPWGTHCVAPVLP